MSHAIDRKRLNHATSLAEKHSPPPGEPVGATTTILLAGELRWATESLATMIEHGEGGATCAAIIDYKSCDGDMTLLEHESTMLGSLPNDTDRNRHTELWECKKCGGKFERTYKWKRWIDRQAHRDLVAANLAEMRRIGKPNTSHCLNCMTDYDLAKQSPICPHKEIT